VKKKDSANAAIKKQQRKTYLKTGIALLAAAAICGWVTYGLLNPKMRYDDFVIDSAVEWLELADREKFDACRKDITDADGWFNVFMSDRKSLGRVKLRSLKSYKELSAVSSGLKRYELKFGTNFSKSPNASEQLIVESDNISKIKVINARYYQAAINTRALLSEREKQSLQVPAASASFPRVYFSFATGERICIFVDSACAIRLVPLTAEEKQRIISVAENVLKKVDARDTFFFKQAYAELAEQPKYFHWKNWLTAEAKSCRRITCFYEILSNGKASPWAFSNALAYNLTIENTSFEQSSVVYIFFSEFGRKI